MDQPCCWCPHRWTKLYGDKHCCNPRGQSRAAAPDWASLDSWNPLSHSSNLKMSRDSTCGYVIYKVPYSFPGKAVWGDCRHVITLSRWGTSGAASPSNCSPGAFIGYQLWVSCSHQTPRCHTTAFHPHLQLKVKSQRSFWNINETYIWPSRPDHIWTN